SGLVDRALRDQRARQRRQSQQEQQHQRGAHGSQTAPGVPEQGQQGLQLGKHQIGISKPAIGPRSTATSSPHNPVTSNTPTRTSSTPPADCMVPARTRNQPLLRTAQRAPNARSTNGSPRPRQ